MTKRCTLSDGTETWKEYTDSIISSLHIHLCCAYRSNLGSEWHCAQGGDSRSRLYYIHSGHGEIAHHGRKFILHPGNLYLIPANTPHSHFCDTLDISWCHFTALFHTGVSFFSIFTPEYELPGHNVAHIGEKFAEMVEKFRDDSMESVVARSGLLMQILSPFLSGISRKSFDNYTQRAERFSRALKTIEDNLCGELRINDLANLSGMSSAHFSREFTKIFGCPPAKYIIRRRIENAQLRLMQSDDTIETIGTELGFCDGFHFSKNFSKIVGLSPGRYRRLCHIP